MNKFKVILITLIVMIGFSTTAIAESHPLYIENKIIEPQSYVDKVIDYTVDAYVYDQFGQIIKVSSKTYYKTLKFQNEYELIDTWQETEGYWNGFYVYTYYIYRTY